MKLRGIDELTNGPKVSNWQSYALFSRSLRYTILTNVCSGVSKYFCKGEDSKHFRFYRPYILSVIAAQFSHWCEKIATGNL